MNADTPSFPDANDPAEGATSRPATTEAPVRTRAPRKKAAAATDVTPEVAVVDAAAPESAPVARRTRRKPVTETADSAGAEAAPVLAPAAEAEAEAVIQRPRRARKATGVLKGPALAGEEAGAGAGTAVEAPAAVAVAAPAEAAAEPTSSTEAVDGAAAQAEPGARSASRRRRKPARDASAGPDRSEARAEGRAAEASSDDGATEEASTEAAVPSELTTTDARQVFEQLASGDWSPDDETESPEEGDDVAHKRVLLPDPDAPKLHKVLAQSGIGSRRDMEQWIAEGLVTVNGQPAHVGQRIAQSDRVAVKGKPVRLRIAPSAPRLLAYHKPTGEVVTRDDPQGRPTVFGNLPALPHGKWLSVGRLDINTEGLLLFTNSGDLANQLMHPRFGVEREYAVRVLGTLDDESRERLLAGVDVEGHVGAFKSIEDGGGEGVNRWYRVVITEGRNREVRKLFAAVGLVVSRLMRIRYASVVLPRGLRRGVWVELNKADVQTLLQLTGLEGLGDRRRRGPMGDRMGNRRGGQGPRQEGGFAPGPAGAGFDQGGADAAGFDGAAPGAGQPGAYPAGGGQGGQRGPGGKSRNGKNRGKGGPGYAGAVAGGAPGASGAAQGRGPGAQADGPARGPRGGKGRGPGGQGGPGRAASGQGERSPYIPNPLMQTYDTRAIQNERREARSTRFDDENGPIPNPLEQTYDKRFVQKKGFIGASKGQRNSTPGGQPDPMQTSVGYIGADAFYKKMIGRGGGGKRRG